MSEEENSANRRQRLQEMRKRRKEISLVDEKSDTPQKSSEAGPTRLGKRRRGGQQRGGQQTGEAKGRVWKAAMWWLDFATTQSQQSGGRQIEGTPLTEEGLAKGVERLNQFVDRQGKGAKVAMRLRKFLTSNSEGAETVSGVSVEQVKRLLDLAGREKSGEKSV